MLLTNLLLLSTALLGFTLLRWARGTASDGRGYALSIAAVLGLGVSALLRDSAFLAITSIGLTGLLVVVPWGLERAARLAFDRGRFRWAVALATTRATLMPGSGLSRQHELLRGLALLEREGVDGAVAHYQRMAAGAEDPVASTLIHEQIVSMLLYGQRWQESISHYESRFHFHYAALRPTLALGLLRAYGEAGQLERAALLLRALEEGPLGSDPRAVSMMGQARLTFLAYAGAAGLVKRASTERGGSLLGLSPASGALIRGIAYLRAGETALAKTELERAHRLASSRDERVADACRRTLQSLEPERPAVALAPDLRQYTDKVAERLEALLQVAPAVPPGGAVVVTPALAAALALHWLSLLAVDPSGPGLLRWGGLTPPLWEAGEWPRLLSGVLLHADGIALLVNLYGLWLAGPLLERMLGSARLLLLAVGGGMLGLAAAAVGPSGPFDLLPGGNFLASAVVGGAVGLVLPRRRLELPARARRAVLVPVSAWLLLQALARWPGVFALEVSTLGLAAAVGGGAALTWIPRTVRGRRIERGLALALALAGIAAVGWTLGRDPGAAASAGAPQAVTVGSARLALPPPFVAAEPRAGAPVPVLPGAIDAVAARMGHLVQLVAARPESEDATVVPLVLDPALAHAVTVTEGPPPPDAFVRAYEAAGRPGEHLASFTLRLNGEPIAWVVQPPPQPDGEQRALLAAPPSALEPRAAAYGAVLAAAADQTPPAQRQRP